MTGRIVNVKRFAVHDGDGIRTTVFFKGCPLHCLWCHNPESITFEEELAYYAHKCTDCGACGGICPANEYDGKHVFSREACRLCKKCLKICPNGAFEWYGKEVSVDELLEKLLEDKSFYQTSNGGVTLSGGECLMQAEFCAELLKKCKENGLHTAVDTCGYVKREAFDLVIPYTDVFLYDIKAYEQKTHISCTGKSNERILQNLLYLEEKGCDIEIRIPYAPEYNHGEMDKIARFLSGLQSVSKIKILPVHNFTDAKRQALGLTAVEHFAVPTAEQLEEVKAVFEKNNLSVIVD